MEDEDSCNDADKTTLDQKTASAGLSNFGWNAGHTNFVYRDLELCNKGLADVSILEKYMYIEKLNLCHNKLKDVSAINNMESLMDLNLSQNKLYAIPNFPAPKLFLKRLDLSYNDVEDIRDLSDCIGLECINLEGNKIQEIQGFQCLKFLKTLNLKGNKIKNIENLDSLPIRVLDLSCNCLTSINGLQDLKVLMQLDLSRNKIRSLSGLEGLCELSHLNLECNVIMDLSEICKLRSLGKLEHLNMKFNPISDLPKFRPFVIFEIPSLIALNQEPVTIQEKVEAEYILSPPIEYSAARNFISNMVYSFFRPQKLLHSILPDANRAYPILILVGPQGMGKVGMAIKLSLDFPDKIRYVPCHTSREPYPEEVNGRHYCFVEVEQFQQMTSEGSFVATYSLNNNLYGFGRNTFEEAAKENLACVTCMELEGAMAMSYSHLKPIYVLFMPSEEDSYERRLLEKNCFQDREIKENMRRLCLYCRYKQKEPSFFHAVITGDDLIKAYEELKSLVSEYLDKKDIVHDLRKSTTQKGEECRKTYCPDNGNEFDGKTKPPGDRKEIEADTSEVPPLMTQISKQLNFKKAYKAVSGQAVPMYDKVVEKFKLKNLNKGDPRCRSLSTADLLHSRSEVSSYESFDPCHKTLPRMFSVSSASVRNWRSNDNDESEDVSTQTQTLKFGKKSIKGDLLPIPNCKNANPRTACQDGKTSCISAPRPRKSRNYETKKKCCLPSINS